MKNKKFLKKINQDIQSDGIAQLFEKKKKLLTPLWNQKDNDNNNIVESGRSMVEMLGVLAVIGVLSVGGIAGYTYAMNKYRANQLTNELNLTSSQIALMLLKTHNEAYDITLGEPWDNGGMVSGDYDFFFGCGVDFTSEVITCEAEENAYYLRVENIPEEVCRPLVQMTGNLRYLVEQQVNGTIDLTGASCQAGNNTLVTFFETTEADAEDNPAPTPSPTPTPEPTPSPTPEPPINCGEHGTYSWSLNKCQCHLGYTGVTCSDSLKEACVAGGNSWGDWNNECTCVGNNKGGLDCTLGSREACNNHGNWYICGSGCNCDEGWGGIYCEHSSEDYCVHGNLYGSYCTCDDGYAGNDCSQTVANRCSGHGSWNSGACGGYCSCDSGYAGNDCSQTTEEVCNGHGRWSGYSGYCLCDDGYAGSYCSQTEADRCSGHGRWAYGNGGHCSCDSGWAGSDCSQTEAEVAAEHCSGHGSWDLLGGYCRCNSGWAGNNCSQTEADRCSEHGSWQGSSSGGYCYCNSGYVGSDCSQTCQHAISTASSSGGCLCDSGWAGIACDIPESEYCKNGFWQSQSKYCICHAGYSGEHCDVVVGS